MVVVPEAIERELQALDAEMATLRREHPDDFWTQWERRTHPIVQRAPTQAHALVAKRLDAILIAHGLGPADPGA